MNIPEPQEQKEQLESEVRRLQDVAIELIDSMKSDASLPNDSQMIHFVESDDPLCLPTEMGESKGNLTVDSEIELGCSHQ